MKRRTFVKGSAALTAAAALTPKILKAKDGFSIIPNDKLQTLGDDNIVIIVELFGGNDGLNTVIPVYNDTYYNIRPNIGIPANIAKRFQSTDVYFNPALVTNVVNNGFMGLMENGRLAVIEGIGYEPSNLSHFRSQDIWQSGINTSDPNVNLLEGWLGRFIANQLPNFPNEIPAEPIAVQIDNSLSMLLKTNKGDMGIALTDPQSFFNLGKGLTPVEGLMTGNSVYENEFNFVYITAKMSELYSAAVMNAYTAGQSKIKGTYTDGLSQKFKLISTLIAGGLKTKFYYLGLSNFDSHAQEVNADFLTGQHPTLLNQVARGISEFLDDLQKQGIADRVVGLTFSEFGRRSYENGSRGTDHGAASVQFAFGNYVKGGYYGNNPGLNPQDLDENGNIKMQFDYRRTYVDFLQTWVGAKVSDTDTVFADTYLPVGILRSRSTGVIEPVAGIKGNQLNIYPNPSPGSSTLNFELKVPSKIEISLFNNLGIKIKNILKGYYDAGNHIVNISVENSGSYFVALLCENKYYTTDLIVIK